MKRTMRYIVAMAAVLWMAIPQVKAQGLEKVSCTFAIDNEKLETALKARGFAAESGDLITMEIVF